MGSWLSASHIIKKEAEMIKLTRLDGNPVAINEEFIDNIYQAPDTIIMMQNGRTHVVKESIDEIIALAIEYKKTCLNIDII